MTNRFAAGVVLLLAGCPVGSLPDGVDGGGTEDGGTGTSGITVTWACSSDIPGSVTANVIVEEVRLDASSLRLIGDSAAPGDPRTTRAPIELRWYQGETPTDEELDSAPSGLYSRLELGTGGSDEHLQILGQALLLGEWRDFEVDDQRQHAIMNDMVLSLAPGQRATIPVNIDLAVVLMAVPFADLRTDGDGTLVFEDNDPRLDAVWAAVDAAISVPSSFAVE